MPSRETIALGIYEKALPALMTWHERLDMAAQAGFAFIEISIDENEYRLERLDWGPAQRAELRHAITDTGIPITSMCLSGHRKYPMGSASPEVRQKSLDILLKAIDLAHDIGARILLVPGYDVFYEPSDAGTQARFLEGLQQGVAWASSAGVMLALENTDHFIMSISKAMRFVTELNSPWLQLYVDIGNLVAVGLDVEVELDAGRGHIAGLHVKDAKHGEFRGIAFGHGTVPFVRAFRKLWQTGFFGPIMLEMWLDAGKDSLRTISDARAWVWAAIEESMRDLPEWRPAPQREDVAR